MMMSKVSKRGWRLLSISINLFFSFSRGTRSGRAAAASRRSPCRRRRRLHTRFVEQCELWDFFVHITVWWCGIHGVSEPSLGWGPKYPNKIKSCAGSIHSKHVNYTQTSCNIFLLDDLALNLARVQTPRGLCGWISGYFLLPKLLIRTPTWCKDRGLENSCCTLLRFLSTPAMFLVFLEI